MIFFFHGVILLQEGLGILVTLIETDGVACSNTLREGILHENCTLVYSYILWGLPAPLKERLCQNLGTRIGTKLLMVATREYERCFLGAVGGST